MASTVEGYRQSLLQVCMVLRMLSEEVTWTGEGGSQTEAPESRRALLSALVETLDTALPYLHSCLESHFMLAGQAGARNDQQASEAHSAVVKAALGAYALEFKNKKGHTKSCPIDICVVW